MTTNQAFPASPAAPASRRDVYPYLLGIIVLLAHAATRAELYFADGPKQVQAIKDGTFVIQPPGYWLFNRFAGLFPDPVLAISAFNLLCSALGAVVFYLCARSLFSDRNLARWAAAFYGFIFYAWFSAGVHSTYASQLFFPVCTFYCFLQYQNTGRAGYLYAAAVVFSIGAGLRPSDGAFFLPFFCLLLFRVPDRRRAVASAGLTAVLCLAWLVPTLLALHNARGYAGIPAAGVGSYMRTVTTFRSILQGLNRESLATVTRVVVAFAVAFWPLLIAIVFAKKRKLDTRARGLWLWILPGLLFFLLSYFADAPYLNFMTAPIVLLGFFFVERCGPRVRAATIALCLATNIGFFLFFRPKVSHSLPVNIVNCYAGRFSWYSMRLKSAPNLSEVMKDPTLVTKPTE